MELAALYERQVARNLGVSVYLAPVGEPALGPVAFPHRPSAAADPFAPISHHWQDATHISFGVISAGLFTRTVKLEGSIFNGREPDDDRYDFDYKGRSLDSYSGRLTVNPDSHWSVGVSYGYLKSPEGLRPAESTHRGSLFVLSSRRLGGSGSWSSVIIFGANKHPGTSVSISLTAESNLDLDGRNTIFGRLDYTRKSAEELVRAGFPPDRTFDLGSVALGYLREVTRVAGLDLGAGIRGSLNVVPRALESIYGSRTATGLSVYLRVRPKMARMRQGMMDMMPGH